MSLITLQFPPDLSYPRHINAFPQPVGISGTNFPFLGLAYDAAQTEETAWQGVLNGYHAAYDPVLNISWYADTASSGNVVWGGALACLTPNEDSTGIGSATFPTEETTTDSHLGTTGQRLHKASITLTNGTKQNNDFFALRVRRLGADASDTMSGDAILVMAELEYQSI